MVTHDGGRLLGQVIDALEAQTYEQLEILAVDNGSTDGSRELLFDRLGTDRVLVAGEDLGFTGAVSFALDARIARHSPASWILLVHDDLVLEPDAVARLVEHVERDPRVAVAGPKLRTLHDPRYLQQVGMSADLTGRADSGVEEDELDHGQLDTVGRVLYVTTAGMFLRRETFEELGRFDPRYRMFREDLDLCWRAWIAGHDVEVVSRAIGHHQRSHAEDLRVGETASVGRHYLAERNTLATLLKCYSLTRLLYVIPLFFLVGIAKLGGFVFTRRISDVYQTLRAWGWNVSNLRSTLRLRRRLQAQRLRTDGELRPLFIGPATRLRAYSEAVGERLIGDDLGVADDAPATGGGLRGVARRRPGLFVAAGIVLLAVVAAVPLLGSGTLRGGDIATWPSSWADPLRTYLSPWLDAGGAGSAAPPSPAQAMLSVVGLLAFGSEWLAPRLLLVAAVPAAWLVALRAARLLTPERGPRLIGATLYALNPAALASVLTGRLGAMVTFVGLPLFALAFVRTARVNAPRAGGWKAAAVTALVAATIVAFEPPAAMLLLPVFAVGLIVVAGVVATARDRIQACLRLVAAVVGGTLLLGPWLPVLLRTDGPLRGGFSAAEGSSAPFVRWLLLVPEMSSFPGVLVGAAFVAAGATALLAAPVRPLAVGATFAVTLAAVFTAWGVGITGTHTALWPGLPLIVAGLGYAALLVLALEGLPAVLRARSFGWRQLAAGLGAAVVALGAGGAVWHFTSASWDALTVDEPALPAFIGVESDLGMRYRVLTLVDEDGTVRWDVTDGDGPTMLEYGAPPAGPLGQIIGSTVDDIVSGVSPQAATRLGHANVHYIHVPEGGRSEELEAALGEQLALEPQPVERGLVYEVGDWLPRVSYVGSPVAAALVRQERLPDEAEIEPLYREGYGRWVGSVPARGAVAIAEPDVGGWGAVLDGEELEPVAGFGLVRFSVPGEGEVTVTYDDGGRRAFGVSLQVVVALLLISFAIRAPWFAREELR